jgi:hypothetical protein
MIYGVVRAVKLLPLKHTRSFHFFLTPLLLCPQNAETTLIYCLHPSAEWQHTHSLVPEHSGQVVRSGFCLLLWHVEHCLFRPQYSKDVTTFGATVLKALS